MSKLFFYLFLFACNFAVFAQYDVNTAGNVPSTNSGLWVVNSNNTDNKIEGSPYLFENWNTKGIITSIDDKTTSIQNLNYDIIIDAIVLKMSADSLFIFENKNIKEVKINNKTFKRFYDSNTSSYFQVLAVGQDLRILKKYELTIREGVFNQLTQQKSTPDKYIINESYHSMKENRIQEFKLNKKSLCELFGENSSKIKKFISTEKMDIKNEENLQLILNYNDTL